MEPGARTPEELERLYEDAFVTRDLGALDALFEDGAMLVAGRGTAAHGGVEIARAAASMWERELTYVADPVRVVQARDTALVFASGGINVMRRGIDRVWRYAISVIELDTQRMEQRHDTRE